MRIPDKPLPGDYVVRRRQNVRGTRVEDDWIVYAWPDPEVVVGGPNQSDAYAFQQARTLVTDPSTSIWRHHDVVGNEAALELVYPDESALSGL